MIKRPRRFLLCAAIPVLGVALLFSDVTGQDLSSPENGFTDSPEIPWHVTAFDRVTYDREADEITAFGNVVIEKESLRLSAESVRFNRAQGKAIAEGNPRLTMGEDVFSGSRLELSLKDETGDLYDGVLFLKQNNFHIRSSHIEKTGEKTYRAEDVTLTTCDGDAPAWEIDGKKFKVTYGGYGVADQVFFKAREIPLFYSPFLVFPVKTERQSGLLAPEIGFSDRKGTEYAQPFFWAISDNTDATVTVDAMTERGAKLGGEYRYALEQGRGMFMLDFLEDQKIDTGDSTYGYSDDDYARTNTDRYWLRYKHDQNFNQDVTLSMDLDKVSDQDYLYEFAGGPSGFADSTAGFAKFVGRGLEDYTETLRTNRLNLEKLGAGYALGTQVLWRDDITLRNQEDAVDTTVQQLPSVYFDQYRQSFLGGLQSGVTARSSYFYQEDGDRGARTDLHPRLYMPYRVGGIIGIEPSLGVRETFWNMDEFSSSEAGDDPLHRETYDVGMTLSSEVARVYHPSFGGADALKHTLRFETAYSYTPELNQDDYPYFDWTDRLLAENQATFSMINIFTTRTKVRDTYQYRRVGRFEIAKPYDLGDGEKELPLLGRLNLAVLDYLSLDGDMKYSTEGNGILSRNLGGTVSDKRGDRLSMFHHFEESLYESINMEALAKLSGKVWVFSDYERNLKDGKEIASGVGGIYRAGCWSFELELRREEEGDDESVRFRVRLYGLGDLGGGSRYRAGLPEWDR